MRCGIGKIYLSGDFDKDTKLLCFLHGMIKTGPCAPCGQLLFSGLYFRTRYGAPGSTPAHPDSNKPDQTNERQA